MLENKKVVLCIDEISASSPEVIGLAGENLSMQPWIEVCTNALTVRENLQNHSATKEIWVLSSTDMDAINLAAALKKDHATSLVILVAVAGTGSLQSRAKAASLDMVLSGSQFVQRYNTYKNKALRESDQSVAKEDAAFRQKASGDAFYKQKPDSTVSLHPKKQEQKVTGSEEQKVPSGSYPAKTLKSSSSLTAKKSAFLLPIVSASGGSGKSTTAIAAAYVAQSRGYNTLLIDADLQFGDLAFLTGTEKAATLDEIVGAPSLLSRTKEHTTAPTLLAAPRKLEQSEVAVTGLMQLIEYCSEHFDLIVVNTGAFWLEQHVALLEQASAALFLLDQRPSAMRDCKHALEFCSRCAIATQPFRFVLNRCSRNALFSSIDIACGLQGAPVVELQEGGKEIGELLGAGQPFGLVASKNPFCNSIEQMLDDLLPHKEGTGLSRPRKEKSKEGKRLSILKKRGAACL